MERSSQFHVVCSQRRARNFAVSGFVQDPPPPIPPIEMAQRTADPANAKGANDAPLEEELSNQPRTIEERKVAQFLGGGASCWTEPRSLRTFGLLFSMGALGSSLNEIDSLRWSVPATLTHIMSMLVGVRSVSE